MAFTIAIELGNAEMARAEHVAGALQEVRDSLLNGTTRGRIFDVNGNSCGYWQFDPPDIDEELYGYVKPGNAPEWQNLSREQQDWFVGAVGEGLDDLFDRLGTAVQIKLI